MSCLFHYWDTVSFSLSIINHKKRMSTTRRGILNEVMLSLAGYDKTLLYRRVQWNKES